MGDSVGNLGLEHNGLSLICPICGLPLRRKIFADDPFMIKHLCKKCKKIYTLDCWSMYEEYLSLSARKQVFEETKDSKIPNPSFRDE